MSDRKTQIIASVEPDTRDRIDALRIVLKVSRARIAARLIEGEGLDHLEDEHAGSLRRVTELAEKAGTDTTTYVRAYAAAYATATYGPGLDALEGDDRRVRKAVKALTAVKAAGLRRLSA